MVSLGYKVREENKELMELLENLDGKVSLGNQEQEDGTVSLDYREQRVKVETEALMVIQAYKAHLEMLDYQGLVDWEVVLETTVYLVYLE